MVSNAVGMSVGSPDPERVTGLFLPESNTDGAAFLDNDARFILAMYCQDAHWHLIDAWDPDHGELSRVSLVEGCVPEPEGSNGRSLLNNPLQSHRTGCV